MICKALMDGAETIVVSYHTPQGDITSLADPPVLTKVKHVLRDAHEAAEAGTLKRRSNYSG